MGTYYKQYENKIFDFLINLAIKYLTFRMRISYMHITHTILCQNSKWFITNTWITPSKLQGQI